MCIIKDIMAISQSNEFKFQRPPKHHLVSELVGGSWFAWGMKWRIDMWWHMIKQMDDGNYKAQ